MKSKGSAESGLEKTLTGKERKKIPVTKQVEVQHSLEVLKKIYSHIEKITATTRN